MKDAGMITDFQRPKLKISLSQFMHGRHTEEVPNVHPIFSAILVTLSLGCWYQNRWKWAYLLLTLSVVLGLAWC